MIENFSDLVGQSLASVTLAANAETVLFTLTDGQQFELYHDQDCCEGVRVEEFDGTHVDGVFTDLVGLVLLATAESNETYQPERSYDDSHTWTFYRISTIKGTVVLRWLGESNGYYSEGVSFRQVRLAVA